MNPDRTGQADRAATLVAAIERLGAQRFRKDIGLVEAFAPDAVVAGSEAAELHFGAAEVRQHFETNMGKPHTVRWVWDRLDTRIEGDTGWFFAHGNAMGRARRRGDSYPFRMSGVLSWSDGRWNWRLLHGSEPA